MKLKHSDKSRNSKVISQTTSRSTYRKLLIMTDPYWDEGIAFYPQKMHGWAKPRNGGLMKYEQRMYRTWKHSRKHQWKN